MFVLIPEIMIREPRVSIVILNYNGKAFLEKFLDGVVRSAYSNLEVVVADNGSSDDSVPFLKNRFPSVRLICMERNAGFAEGYNLAMQQVEADYFVLLNSDVEVTQRWLEPLISLMESDSSIAACQPKILSFDRRDEFEYAGASGGWIDSLGYPFMRGRIFDVCEKDNGQYDDAVPCFWASGACLFIRASAWKKVGGFDSFFFAHQEEIDLCWRLQLTGYKVYVQPSSIVYHVGGGTLPLSARKIFLNYRNNMVMIYKNLPAAELLWKLPLRFILNGLSAIRELLTGRFDYFLAIHRAKMAFLGWLLFKQKQSLFPRSRSQKIPFGRYRGMVIWDSFIKRRRTFSEIMSRR